MTLATLALVALSQQASSPKVEVIGLALPAALKKIGDAYGVTLTANTGLKDVIVSVRTLGKPLGEVRKMLAKGLHATWTGDELGQTPIQRRDDTNAIANLRWKKLRGELASLTKSNAKYPTLDEKAVGKMLEPLARLMETERGSDDGAGNRGGFREPSEADMQAVMDLTTCMPNMRLAMRLAQSLDLTTVNLQAGERRVFSTKPIGMQQRLNINPASLIASYNQERKMFVAAVEKSPFYKQMIARGEGTPQDVEQWMKPLDATKSEIWVILKDDPGGVTAEIRVGNSKTEWGETMVIGGGALDYFDYRERAKNPRVYQMLYGSEEPANLEMAGNAVAPSNRKAQTSTHPLVSVLTREKKFSDLSAELRARILAPDQFDPLSEIAAALFSACAPADKPFVAVHSDLDFAELSDWSDAGRFAEERVEDGWILHAPYSIVDATRQRFDRAQLKRILVTFASGRDDIGTRMAIAAAARSKAYPEQFEPTPGWYRMLFAREASDSDIGLVVMSTLTSAQLDMAATPNGLPIQQLTPDQIDTLARLYIWRLPDSVYEAEATEAGAPPTAGAAVGADAEAQVATAPDGPQRRRTDVTTLLPNGLPATMRFSLQRITTVGALPAELEQEYGNYLYRPFELAETMVYRGESRKKLVIAPDTRFRTGTVTEANLTISFRPKLDSFATTTFYSRSDKLVPYKELPADYRKEFEEHRQIMEKEKRNGGH